MLALTPYFLLLHSTLTSNTATNVPTSEPDPTRMVMTKTLEMEDSSNSGVEISISKIKDHLRIGNNRAIAVGFVAADEVALLGEVAGTTMVEVDAVEDIVVDVGVTEAEVANRRSLLLSIFISQ